jgi:hypothetical protein
MAIKEIDLTSVLQKFVCPNMEKNNYKSLSDSLWLLFYTIDYVATCTDLIQP